MFHSTQLQDFTYTQQQNMKYILTLVLGDNNDICVGPL